jgi:hypothetical protein
VREKISEGGGKFECPGTGAIQLMHGKTWKSGLRMALNLSASGLKAEKL